MVYRKYHIRITRLISNDEFCDITVKRRWFVYPFQK